jgi:hypothetical protein
VAEFGAVVPRDPSLCGTHRPWASGERHLRRDEPLHSHGCFALELTAAQAADVMLLMRESQGTWVRLFPSGCDDLFWDSVPHLRAGESLRFPDRVIRLDSHSGTETFYLLAMENVADREAARSILAALPAHCERREHVASSPLPALSRLEAEAQGRIDRRTLRLPHGSWH